MPVTLHYEGAKEAIRSPDDDPSDSALRVVFYSTESTSMPYFAVPPVPVVCSTCAVYLIY